MGECKTDFIFGTLNSTVFFYFKKMHSNVLTNLWSLCSKEFCCLSLFNVHFSFTHLTLIFEIHNFVLQTSIDIIHQQIVVLFFYILPVVWVFRASFSMTVLLSLFLSFFLMGVGGRSLGTMKRKSKWFYFNTVFSFNENLNILT